MPTYVFEDKLTGEQFEEFFEWGYQHQITFLMIEHFWNENIWELTLLE